MYTQDQQPNHTDAPTSSAKANWLAFDCESLGRLVRESAHRSVAVHMVERVQATLDECEVIA